MNVKFLSVFIVVGLATPALLAAEPEANGEAKPAVARYQLKNRSVFNFDANARPPFWPIGWVHRAGSHEESQTGLKYVLEEKNFAVTSILMGPPAIAFINGRAYEEGQFLRQPRASAAGAVAPARPVATGANPLRIRVQRITDGQVWLGYDTQIIGVPLKRPELNERKGSQELLNEEKEDFGPAPTPAPAVSKR
jgi:hypothetical protein